MGLDSGVARPTSRQTETFFATLLDGPRDPFLAGAPEKTWNVFQSDVFLSAIEQHIVAPSEKLLLIGVKDRDDNPVAVFPFVKRRRFGIPFLEAVDFGITDFFAPTYFRDKPLSEAETTSLWRVAIRAVPGVHAVLFKKMPRMLHNRRHALSSADFLKPMNAEATTLFLRDASGEPTGSMDPASVSRKLKKSARVLLKFGPLSFEEALNKQDVEAYLKVLVCFRTARFEQLGRYDALLDPNVVAFYRTLADRCAGDKPGRLFALRSGDEIIAVTYGFAYRNAFTLIAPAITTKKEFQAGSPGLVAMFKTLEWCQREGFTVFDLSVGSLSYKSRFEADTIELFEHQEALSPLGLPIVAEGWLRRWVRRQSLSHPWLRTTLEKLRREPATKARNPDADA